MEILGAQVVLVRSSFPLLEGGNAVRFCLFVFFVSGSASFVVFSVLLFLGSLFDFFFSGANFCFWASVSVVFVLVMFCLCFCFISWFFVPENVLRKFSFGQVRFLNKFLGANFCFGNRTVTVSLFPLFWGGNAVRFFHFVFFVSGSASFVVFLPFLVS